MNENSKILPKEDGSLDSITELDAKLKEKVEKIRENSASKIAEARMKAAERVRKAKRDAQKQCHEEYEIQKTQLEEELKKSKNEDKTTNSIQISIDRKTEIADEIVKRVIGS